MKRILLALSLATMAAWAADDVKVAPLITKDLTGITGKEASMLTVEYPPGGASNPHRHNAFTFVYVLEGSVVMQVKGGPEVTLGPGQTFYESPEDIHAVSRNASKTQPAKILVFFVKNEEQRCAFDRPSELNEDLPTAAGGDKHFLRKHGPGAPQCDHLSRS